MSKVKYTYYIEQDKDKDGNLIINGKNTTIKIDTTPSSTK